MLPTFLGIGAPRCATTWLHHVLRQHPEIQMTAVKEISFFGRTCLRHDLAWYEAMFDPTAERPAASVRGDISPWYTRVSPQSVAAAHRLMPDAKLVFIIRNPIDRAWSHALMELTDWGRGKRHTPPVWRFLFHFERRRQIWFSDYERTIDSWTTCYPQSALHIDLYDRLLREPGEFLRDILAHIGADPSWRPTDEKLRERTLSFKEASGGKEGMEMPAVVRWYLATQWLEPTRRLNQRLGGRVSHWVKEMEEITRDAPLSWRIRRNINRWVLRWPERFAFHLFDTVQEARLSRAYARVSKQNPRRDSAATPVAAGPASAAEEDVAIKSAFAGAIATLTGLIFALAQAMTFTNHL